MVLYDIDVTRNTNKMAILNTRILTSLIVMLSFAAFAQRPMAPDLHRAFQHHKIDVYNRDLSLINEEGYHGIRLSKAFGEGIAWMKDITFSTGTLEFDVRGEDLKQHSFVGIAFHGQNDSTYDAVYLRPFHFHAEDTVSQNRMIQFISLPAFTWRKLRAEFPGRFEGHISPPPDPIAWVHVSIEVTQESITTYINGSNTPSLVAHPLKPLPPGKVGFYVADTSGGDFANLTIINTR